MRFVIPLQRDELLTPKEAGVYRVEDVYPIRELQSKLKVIVDLFALLQFSPAKKRNHKCRAEWPVICHLFDV